MLHPAAQAADGYVPGPEYTPGPRTVIVKDTGGEFEPQTTRMPVNEKVTFVLEDEAQQKHLVDFCNPYVPCEDRWQLRPSWSSSTQRTPRQIQSAGREPQPCRPVGDPPACTRVGHLSPTLGETAEQPRRFSPS